MEGLFWMYQPTPGLLANQGEGFELVMIELESNILTTMMASSLLYILNFQLLAAISNTFSILCWFIREPVIYPIKYIVVIEKHLIIYQTGIVLIWSFKVFPLKKTCLFAIKIHPIDNVCSECDESSQLLKDHFVTHRCDSLKISEMAVFHCILGTQYEISVDVYIRDVIGRFGVIILVCLRVQVAKGNNVSDSPSYVVQNGSYEEVSVDGISDAP